MHACFRVPALAGTSYPPRIPRQSRCPGAPTASLSPACLGTSLARSRPILTGKWEPAPGCSASAVVLAMVAEGDVAKEDGDGDGKDRKRKKKKKWRGRKGRPTRDQLRRQNAQYVEALQHLPPQEVLGGVKMSSQNIANLLKAIGDSPGGTKVALEVFDFLQGQEGARVNTPHPWTVLMMLCGRDGRHSMALQLFQVMVKAGVVPSQVTYNVLIATCAREGKADLAMELFEDMKAAGLSGTEPTFVALFKACDGRSERVAEVLGWMRLARVAPNTIVYNAAINACRREGAAEVATGLLARMKREKVPRDENTYTTLITVLGRADDPDGAQNVFVEMESELGWAVGPGSVRPCNALITALSRGKRWEEAFTMYDHMVGTGVECNVVTFNALITACQDSGQWQKAIEVYGWMQRSGVQPDVITLNSVLAVMEAGGAEWEKILEVFEGLRAVDIAPDRVSYSLLIAACARDRQLDRAVDTFHKMQRAGVVPDTITYSALISACEKCGQADRAIEVFGWMQDAGVAPNAITYSSVISACERGWRWDKAVEVFQLMQADGIEPTEVAYNALLSSYDKSMQWQRAEAVFDGRAPVGDAGEALATCNSLITACERVGLWQRAMDIFTSMETAGVRGDAVTYEAAISACEQGGQLDRAVQLFEEMQENGIEAGTSACKALVRACVKGNRWEGVQDMFDRMGASGREEGGGVTTISFISMIEALEEAGCSDMALSVFDAALARGAFPKVYDPSGPAGAGARVDLHGLSSVAVATVAFKSWARWLHRRGVDGDRIPASGPPCQIITGWGRHSPSERPVSLLKTEVRKLLGGSLGIPVEYTVPTDNPGVLYVAPAAMYAWLAQRETARAICA